MTELDLEGCAVVAGAFAWSDMAGGDALARLSATEPAFRTKDAAFIEASFDDAVRGEGLLLEQYDEAFVGELEAHRGPITVDDYATLAVGMERGDTESAAAAVRVPFSALDRIERCWVRACAERPELNRQVLAAISVRRSGD